MTTTKRTFYIKCEKCHKFHEVELVNVIRQPTPVASLQFETKATAHCKSEYVSFPDLVTICRFCERSQNCRTEPDDFPDCFHLVKTYMEDGLED